MNGPERVVAQARAMLGVRWRHQGRKPWAVDCAGLVVVAFAAAGWPNAEASPAKYGREPWDDMLRKTLVEAAWLMLRYNPWASRVVQRISRGQKTRRKQALVALARKLLVVCWAMLRHGTAWDARRAASPSHPRREKRRRCPRPARWRWPAR